jgi:tRNA-Thr(GGU) m(6)t(6)A37 methyltransferase TsaA
MEIQPIGTIHSPFRDARDGPIQPIFAEGCEGIVEILPRYTDALLDLEGFERIWLLYWFDRAAAFRAKVKPYMDDKEHGLFATRAPARPNPIGLSCVRLLSIQANTLRVGEVDILDGTPLLDIKPYVGKFDRFEVKRDGWLDTARAKDGRSDKRFFQSDKEGNVQ